MVSRTRDAPASSGLVAACLVAVRLVAAGTVEWTLDIRRELGPAVQVDVGSGWMRIRGAEWYYIERDPESAPSVPVDETLDPRGIELE